jgi:hypothetical protein
MAVASQRVHGVIEHLLDSLELQPQRPGLGTVEVVRLLAVDVGETAQQSRQDSELHSIGKHGNIKILSVWLTSSGWGTTGTVPRA